MKNINETLINSTSVPTTQSPRSHGHTFEDDFLGYILVLFAGVTYSLTQITQKVKLKEYDTLILNFYGGMILAMVSLILSLSTEKMTFPLGILLDIISRGRKLRTTLLKTRKSSCVTARGAPPAAYLSIVCHDWGRG